MLVCVSMIALVSYAQQQVSGVVTDANGEPLIGVSVMIKGTSQGAVTDIDGKYSIPSVSKSDVLNFSYIGYSAQEIKVGSQSTINVKMSDDNKSLDEVVVIGYGTVKRRDLTGAVASVTGDKLAQNPVSNVAQALQGQLPGVSVTTQDGRPGASMSIRVRGGGSITQSNDPLFIVDGMQVSTIDDIPADNIESIDVLKDAASTAIYGARGANGVILVTTKSGKEGKVNVKYNVYYQVKKNPETLEVQDAYDYVYNTWAYATAYNAATLGDGVAKYFGLGSKYGNHLNEYKSVEARNYINDIVKTAHTWNHDVSISGGTSKTKYYATVNYMDDSGMLMNSGFSRWNANLKLTQDITKNLKWDVDVRYAEMKFEGAGYGWATAAYKYRPIDPEFVKGDVTATSGFGNSDTMMEDGASPIDYLNSVASIRTRNRLGVRTGLSWNILKGLTAKTELNLRRNWTQDKDWDSGESSLSGHTGYSLAKLTNGDGYGVRWTTTLNYDVQGLGENHALSFLVGNEVLSNKSNSSYIQGAGYSELTMQQAFGQIHATNSSLGQDEFDASIGTPTHTNSFFGRANYSLLGRYLFTATLRADGSSKFAPNNRWGYFPAAAFAWRVSDEPFMEGAKDWLYNLKFRASLGTSGADNIDPSLWQSTWKTSSIKVDGKDVTTYVPGAQMANPDLKWETTISRNLGIDFGFFDNKLYGSIEAYWNTTKDLLMKVPFAAATGYSYQTQNVGQTSNKGIELSLGAEILRTKDWSLSMNATYNYNKNNVDELMEGVSVDARACGKWGSSMAVPAYDYLVRVGSPVGLIYGFKSLGYYTTDDFNYDSTTKKYTLKPGVPDCDGISNYAEGVKVLAADGQVAVPGMAKFEDTDGNGVVNGDDACVIAKAIPQHTGGFNINARYQNLDFSLGFTYAIGGNVYNANSMHSLMGDKDNSLGLNRLAVAAQSYKYYNVDGNGDLVLATTPEDLNNLNANTKYSSIFSEYGIVTSEFIEDASYLRLNTLTLGYTLPKAWVKKVGLSNVRAYFTGSNLFCIAGYSGLDPDVNTNANAGGQGFPTPYFDYQAYPKARSFTFGLNVAF